MDNVGLSEMKIFVTVVVLFTVDEAFVAAH